MAILDEANLAAEAAKRATYRVNHVGTKRLSNNRSRCEISISRPGIGISGLQRCAVLYSYRSGKIGLEWLAIRKDDPLPAERATGPREAMQVCRLIHSLGQAPEASVKRLVHSRFA